MITLYGGKPMFGLPDASPFVIKTEVLLKMAGVPYAKVEASFSKAPKRKIPYISDPEHGFADTHLGDSTFIRFHLEKNYGADFDKGLSPVDKATAWAFEKMVEDHLYWAVVHVRWVDDANFDRGPKHYFDDVPAPVRMLLLPIIRRSVRKSLHGHGMGRHSKAEVEQLAARDLEALSVFLAGKPWLMGDEPCSADASVWAEVASCLIKTFETPIRTAAESYPNLVAYGARGLQRWFPELAASQAKGGGR